jgi:hypothetical protein
VATAATDEAVAVVVVAPLEVVAMARRLAATAPQGGETDSRSAELAESAITALSGSWIKSTQPRLGVPSRKCPRPADFVKQHPGMGAGIPSSTVGEYAVDLRRRARLEKGGELGAEQMQ